MKLNRKERTIVQLIICLSLAVGMSFTFPMIGIGEAKFDSEETEYTVDTADLDEVQDDSDVSTDDILVSEFFVSSTQNNPSSQIEDLISDVEKTTNEPKEPSDEAPNSSAEDNIILGSINTDVTTTEVITPAYVNDDTTNDQSVESKPEAPKVCPK